MIIINIIRFIGLLINLFNEYEKSRGLFRDSMFILLILGK